jgi:hypothetical protein
MIVYRCQQCGKWSHAARKPKFHQRFVTEDGLNDPDDSVVISYEEGHTDYASGEGTAGGWFVKCGPFDTYEAEKVAA